MEGKLDREKLTQVVGGSAQEIAEFKAVIFGNPSLKAMWDNYLEETESEFEATVCTVSDALDLGFTASNDSYPNIYDNGYSHEEVLRWLKNCPSSRYGDKQI